MIDKAKVKAFWDARAETYGHLDFNSIANLEQDPENLALKVRLESEKVFAYLGAVAGKTVLDLGAGVGQWAFRFAARGAARVTAVEYSAALAAIGREEALRSGHAGVEFVVSPAEEYAGDGTFDVVFISGLFVYMTNDQAETLVAGLPRFCRADTTVLVRDGTGVPIRHEIDNRHSEHLQTLYSATYRTAAEYEDLFARHGFALRRHENMFDEGCPLNKYRETRLRVYEFVRSSGDARDPAAGR
jgi:ubiquinone/menaquinone biosynthesis C-methylase UbiE